MSTKKLVLFIIACFVAMVTVHAVYAADDSDINTRLEKVEKDVSAMKEQTKGEPWLSRDKKDTGLTWNFSGGKVTLYGLADVSVDYVTNGLGSGVRNGLQQQGHNGWQPQISSNLSYFGIRGSRQIAGENLQAVFQFETEVAYSYTPGPTSDSQVKNGLGSRNSYLGLAGHWGAVKVGKTDAPYKTSTAMMDPFDRTPADYNSIIGNTGGDNRAEFDTRLPHVVWYESPRFFGLNLGLLWMPGQNRDSSNEIYAQGETNCTGGNNAPCNDGSYGNAYSMALSYTQGPVYLVTAYEFHKNVNRTGDQAPDANDVTPVTGVHNEWAWKIGGQGKIDVTNTVVSVLYEKTKRVDAVAQFDERSRPDAYYLSITQYIDASHANEIDFAWAHAGKTPGDPGGVSNRAPGYVSGPIDNRSDLLALGVKHNFPDKKTTVYLVGCEQLNHEGAHYDLGASGHGIAVDDKDDGGVNTFAGAHLKAISLGMRYSF